MITREQARKLRALIEKMSAELPDAEAFDAPELFPAWGLKQYTTGDRVQYNERLYKCLQSHTAQSDWTPNVAVSLWVEVSDPSVEFPEWKQPTGAQDAYSKGDKVSHSSKHWVSDYDANVWEPGVYGWSEV